MIAIVGKQGSTVLYQGIQFEVQRPCLLAQQYRAATAAAPTSFFHHIDVAEAIAVQVVGGIARILDERVLVKREHIVGFKTANFDFPVFLLTKKERRIISTQVPGYINQWLNAKAGELIIFPFSVSIESQKNSPVDIPFFRVTDTPVFIVIGFERRQLPRTTGGIKVELYIAVHFQIAVFRSPGHLRHARRRKHAQ